MRVGEFIQIRHDLPRIGCHHDAAPIYDAVDKPAVVITYNLCKDTIFAVAPQTHAARANENTSVDVLADKAWVGKKDRGKLRWYQDMQYVLPIYSKENAIIVMGGMFQREMMHWTVTEGEVVLGWCSCVLCVLAPCGTLHLRPAGPWRTKTS